MNALVADDDPVSQCSLEVAVDCLARAKPAGRDCVRLAGAESGTDGQLPRSTRNMA